MSKRQALTLVLLPSLVAKENRTVNVSEWAKLSVTHLIDSRNVCAPSMSTTHLVPNSISAATTTDHVIKISSSILSPFLALITSPVERADPNGHLHLGSHGAWPAGLPRYQSLSALPANCPLRCSTSLAELDTKSSCRLSQARRIIHRQSACLYLLGFSLQKRHKTIG